MSVDLDLDAIKARLDGPSGLEDRDDALALVAEVERLRGRLASQVAASRDLLRTEQDDRLRAERERDAAEAALFAYRAAPDDRAARA